APASRHNQNAAGPDGQTGFDVGPGIANDEASGQVDTPFLRRLFEHTRLGFAAAAVFMAVVRAVIYFIDSPAGAANLRYHAGVYFLHDRFRCNAAIDDRLIGDDKYGHTGLGQPANTFLHVWQPFKFIPAFDVIGTIF